MPKVLLFRESILPISETFIAAQAGSLREYEVEFCGIRPTRPSLCVPARPRVLLPLQEGRLCRWLTRAYKLTEMAPLFHRALSRSGPNLIHAHFAPDGAIACILAEKLNIPLIVTLHGYDVTVKADFKSLYGRLWRRADRFICVSEFIKRKAIEAGFPAKKMMVHYIGVDRARFRPSNSARTAGMALFVGRLVEKKGCTHLLDAMSTVQKRYPQAYLVLIGDGPLRPALEQQASNLNLSCRFLGSQPQPVIQEYLAHASVFCVPSVTASNGDSEGLPIAILEAMAMGIPVVASNTAGIPEAVRDGETGLLAKERNHETLAEHIVRFLEDAGFAEDCARRGSEVVANQFDLKTQTKLLETIYTEVLANSGERQGLTTAVARSQR